MKKTYSEAGEIAQELKAQSDRVQFPGPVLGSSQLSLTPTPRESGPLVCHVPAFKCTYPHIVTHMYT